MPTTRVRLDIQLVSEARSAALLMDRSTKEQIEFWARLGRVAEGVFAYSRLRAIREIGQIRDIDALVAAIDTPEGRELALAEIRRTERTRRSRTKRS